LLVTTNDTSDSFRLIRVCNRVLLFPRLVFDTPGSVHRGRDEGPDHSGASVVGAGIIWVVFAGVAWVGVVVVQGLS